MSKVFEEDFYTNDFDQEMVDYLYNNGWIVCGNTSDNKPSLAQPYLKYGLNNKYFWTSEQETSYCIKLTKQEFKEKIGMATKQIYVLADGTWNSEYKFGDKFEVVSDDHYCFRKGAIITLTEDDGSANPYFEDDECVNWNKIKAHKPEPEMTTKQFTKADLQDGMICTSRCGYIYTVQGDRMVQEDGMYLLLENIGDDLSVKSSFVDLDIMKVEQPIILFTRQEPPTKSPAHTELEKLQEQIAALQEQANKLQGVIG